MATYVHGHGQTPTEAERNIDAQIRAVIAERKLLIRPEDVEVLDEGSAQRDSDGVWHVWWRILI